MYEELVKRLRNISNSDSNIKSNYIGLTMIQAANAIDELLTLKVLADAKIERLEKKNEQLTKKLVRPRPPKRKVCSCGKKKWVQWYHTDTGMWSLQCDNCGKSSRQVKYKSQLNAAWNEIADAV